MPVLRSQAWPSQPARRQAGLPGRVPRGEQRPPPLVRACWMAKTGWAAGCGWVPACWIPLPLHCVLLAVPCDCVPAAEAARLQERRPGLQPRCQCQMGDRCRRSSWPWSMLQQPEWCVGNLAAPSSCQGQRRALLGRMAEGCPDKAALRQGTELQRRQRAAPGSSHAAWSGGRQSRGARRPCHLSPHQPIQCSALPPPHLRPLGPPPPSPLADLYPLDPPPQRCHPRCLPPCLPLPPRPRTSLRLVLHGRQCLRHQQPRHRSGCACRW